MNKHEGIIQGPFEVAFDITNKCNYMCLHCFNRSSENDRIYDELSDKEVIKLLKDIAQMKPHNVCICGGEPFIRLDLACEIGRIMSSHDVMVSMVTNGYFVTEEKARKLHDSGVNRIQVSVDGSNAESHERLRQHEGSFQKALEAIKIFNKVGFGHIGVAFTPTSFNTHELKDTYNLCKDLGVTEFRVQPLMLLGRSKENMEDILPSPLQYRNLVRDINEIQFSTLRPKIQWGDPIDHLMRFSTVSKHIMAFLTIQANGDIVASPYLPITVGNIKRHSILEYWDKGLSEIWKFKLVGDVAQKIKCVSDFKNDLDGLPEVWFEENIKLDMIDDHLLTDNIDMGLKEYIQKHGIAK